MQLFTQRGTRIVASIGRTLSTHDDLRRAIEAGADAFRLVLGLRDRDHVLDLATLRRAIESAGRNVAAYLDLPATRPRIGEMPEHQFRPGGIAYVYDASDAPEEDRSAVPLPGLSRYIGRIKPGHRLLFRDGRQQFEVVEVFRDAVKARCITCTEPLRASNGCTFPDSNVRFEPVLSEQASLMQRMAERGLRPDGVLLSFTTTPEQVADARAQLGAVWPGEQIAVIAKVETDESLEHFEALLDAADGILLGRGDLGLSVPPERIPKIQERVANRCRETAKPLFVATQILEVFARTGKQYRAELSDIAQIARQGAGALVLCAETNDSARPVECIELARRIIEAEQPAEQQP